MSKVELEINDKTVEAETDQTILEACEENDIYVPTLCDYIGLSEVGACRMCLVEIDGDRLETACTTKVDDGLEIQTDTEKLWEYRKTIMELTFSEENHFCMYCELDNDCELQEMFRKAEMNNVRFPMSFKKQKVDNTSKYITIDRDRCILCGRCVRKCREKVGNDTLDFSNRGRETKIVADDDVPLGSSHCIECGACAQACPTGAIFESYSSYRGNEENCEITESTCLECSVGCGIEVLTQSDNLVKINGTGTEDVSGGQLCRKGRFEVLDKDRERVEKALINRNGRRISVSLDEAVDRVRKILENNEKINAVMSGRLPSETANLFYEVMKNYEALLSVPGSEKKKLEERIMDELDSLGTEVNGDIFLESTENVLEAENIVVYGTEVVDTHPVFSSYLRRASKNGANLITIDTGNDRFRKHSDISINIGSPESQLTGITLELLRKNADSVSELSNLHLEDINVNTADIMRMVSHLEEKDKNVLVIGPGIDDVQSLLNIYALSISTGSKVVSLGEVSNHALYDLETDPLYESSEVSYLFAADDDRENLDKMIEVARNSDIVIAQASRHSDLTDIADVVIPSLDWFEREGTLEDLNGEEKEVEKVMEAKTSVKSDKEIFEKLVGGSDE